MIRTDPDRPAVQRDHETGEWYIRASAFGGCIRSLAAAGREVEPQPVPDWMQKAFDEGHLNEPIIRGMAFAAEGVTRVPPPEGREQHSARLTLHTEHGIAHLNGSVDDLALIDGEMFVHEYKAMGPSYVAKLRPIIEAGGDDVATKVLATMPPQYAWQLSAYMHGASAETQLSARLVIGVKDETGVVTELLPVVTFTTPPHSLAEIHNRVTEIVRHAAGEGDYPPCDVEMYPCPYYLLHDDEPELHIVTGDDAVKMRLAVDSLTTAKQMEAAAKAMKDGAYKEIRELLGDHAKAEVAPVPGSMDHLKVTWITSEVAESTRTIKAHTKSYPRITQKERK